MKYLIAVETSEAAQAAVDYAEAARCRGADVEVVVMNVQPKFNRRVSQFSTRAARDGLREQLGAAAMAGVLGRLATLGLPFRATTMAGDPAQCIAELAYAERVDEILVGMWRPAPLLGWMQPSMVNRIASRTDVPVTIIMRDRERSARAPMWPAGAVAPR